MRSLFFVVFALFSLVLPLSGQNARARDVLDTETRRFGLMTKADTFALAPLLAAELFYIHSNGLTETKAQHLSAIAAGRLVYRNMEREEVAVRFYGKKTALTNGIVKVSGILNGNAFELRLRYTALYRRQKGLWRLVNWQSTRI